MHEMSLMASLMEIIEDHARREGFRTVRRVHLEIGRLAGVEPEAVRFAFDVVTADSLAQGAELVIQETEGVGRCPVCGAVAGAMAIFDPCPACGQCPREIVEGKELRILSLDVE